MQNKNNDISDKEIISLFNERSEQAISKTSDKYKNLCFKIANNILNDKRDSEECVSDTWLALWNNIPPKSPNPLKAYICRIVKNLSLKRYEYNSAGKRMDLSGIQTSNFNTSHVTVYLLRSYNRKLSIMISIHLMLRFIITIMPYN